MRLSRVRITVRRLMVAVAVVALLSLPGITWLLGPILLVMDVSPENRAWGIGFSLLLIPCLAIGVTRQRWWSVAMAVLAGLAWLFLGIIGCGIGC